MATTAAPILTGTAFDAALSVKPMTTLSGMTALTVLRPALRHAPVELPDAAFDEVRANVAQALDAVVAEAREGDYSALTQELIDLLQVLKSAFSARTWREAVLPAARAHPIARMIHECPFTRHSFTQPRGYPGDAGLLDFVYRHPASQAAREAATDAGRTVMSLTVDVTACEAVRQRRAILAGKIDEAADRHKDVEILAVACGHLREAELSLALRTNRVGRLLATDQDPTSLAAVSGYRETLSEAIEARRVSVRELLTGRGEIGTFHFVYAAGLYDYLDARTAARLTRNLFERLKPGGRLLVPNFLWGVREEAYMEVFMDWYLLYRTASEVRAFADEIDPAAIEAIGYAEDPSRTIGYLEIQRR